LPTREEVEALKDVVFVLHGQRAKAILALDAVAKEFGMEQIESP